MGLAANCSVAFSLSTLGPVAGFGSNIFCGIFATYFRASGWVWQHNCWWNFRYVLWGQWVVLTAKFSLSTLGLLPAKHSATFSLSTLRPVGGVGSELVPKYFGQWEGLAAKLWVELSLSTPAVFYMRPAILLIGVGIADGQMLVVESALEASPVFNTSASY